MTHVDQFVTPNDVGRIPGKIASGFSGFTAEQYRNWTLIFSLSALKDKLPHQHFSCWHYFVKACHLMCRREISVEQVEEADNYIDLFCTKFEQLYTAKYCNINLHLHGHLKACILDHGPVYSFWLFAFERLNGVMESFHTNFNDVSLQLMRQFTEMHSLGFEYWPREYKQDFIHLLKSQHYNKGSLMQSSLESTVRCKETFAIFSRGFAICSLIWFCRDIEKYTRTCTYSTCARTRAVSCSVHVHVHRTCTSDGVE